MFFGLILTGVLALCAPCRADASPVVTIVIDPGHGGRSEEADETNSGCKYHGLEEKNVNLVTALAMYDELNEYGNVDVYLTRDVDGELSLARRVEFADEVNADVLISVHYNASADHNFFGSEIFT
ncbi:MAG: N-acetylmuramoyl-L-alanine amidase, partial [Lachnospiraceae bacterium]|nr:N-acetylmuramoyl-L-alanine amidase [Lachnospiraceae bacterium]